MHPPHSLRPILHRLRLFRMSLPHLRDLQTHHSRLEWGLWHGLFLWRLLFHVQPSFLKSSWSLVLSSFAKTTLYIYIYLYIYIVFSENYIHSISILSGEYSMYLFFRGCFFYDSVLMGKNHVRDQKVFLVILVPRLTNKWPWLWLIWWLQFPTSVPFAPYLVLCFTQRTDYHHKSFGGMGNKLITN